MEETKNNDNLQSNFYNFTIINETQQHLFFSSMNITQGHYKGEAPAKVIEIGKIFICTLESDSNSGPDGTIVWTGGNDLAKFTLKFQHNWRNEGDRWQTMECSSEKYVIKKERNGDNVSFECIKRG